MKIYLAGGIAGLNPDEVCDRFNQMKEALERMGLEVLSPIRGKKLDTEVDQRYESNEIVDRDLWDISHADLMIATPSYKSIGTYMEIFFAAYVRHIPVIVVANHPSIYNHYWIRRFASKVVGSHDEALAYLKEWYL